MCSVEVRVPEPSIIMYEAFDVGVSVKLISGSSVGSIVGMISESSCEVRNPEPSVVMYEMFDVGVSM